MALFKSSPEKAIQREIEAAEANRERLRARLAETDQAIARHMTVAQDCALSGDDAGLDAAEAATHAAQHRAKTLGSALSELDHRLADLGRQQAEMADRKLRSETAAEVELLARKLVDAGAEFNASAERLAGHTARAVPMVFDALGLDRFMTICRLEVPAAMELVGKLLRAYADDVIAGKAPAMIPRGDHQAAAPPPAQTPSEPHFKYQAVKHGAKYKGFTG